MPRSAQSSARGTSRTQPTSPAGEAEERAGSSDVYTMAEAARLKGVSYHTVSRAVRRGKLPAQRLGRMALIAAADLRAWRPMRERAPRKYRRREPNPDATPALLDLASGERVDLARRLSTLYEVLHGAAGELPLPEFLALLGERLATALDFKRVAIWGVDTGLGRASLLAAHGRPFSHLPNEVSLEEMSILTRAVAAQEASVIEDVAAFDLPSRAEGSPVTSLFVAPLRIGPRVLGVVVADCGGEAFTCTREQLGLAQAMANQAALALERARGRAEGEVPAEQLAAILENVSEAVFACDADGRVTVINAAGRVLLGLDDRPLRQVGDATQAVELVQRRGFDGQPIAPADVPLLRATRGERVRDQRHLVVRPDGTEQAVSVNAEPIVDANGRPAGAVAIARDISAERAAGSRDAERRVQLEGAAARAAAVADVALAVNAGTDLAAVLQTAIARMTDLLGGLHGAIFFREADGRMTGQVGYRFTGDAAGMEIDPIAVPTTMIAFARRVPLYYTYAEAAPSERVYFDQLGFRAAIIAPLVSGDELIGVAYVNYASDVRRPSDEELSFAGALASQCAVAIDKTRLMDRMESAHRRLLTVVDQLPQGVIIVEAPQGRLVLANRAAEDLWGGGLPEEPGSSLGMADAVGTPFPAGEGPLDRTLRDGKGRFGETLTVPRPDGTRVTALANHAPVVDGGGRIVGAVGVYQDVAQLRALDRAKDEFLSVAAHELRNPLTSLHGNLQLLLRRVQKETERVEDASRLEAIITQSDRLAQLVGRLLDVSRAELGRLDLSVGPTDAAAIARRVTEGARGLSPAHEVVVEAPERLEVVWDEVRIEQVLVNLVGNAVKHTPGGNVYVTLEEAAGDRVRIAVRDDGPGIPDGAKPRLFERYYRGSGRTIDAPAEGDGLGLGLYISRQIVLVHGGELTVADAPSGGALFVATLPREARAGASPGGALRSGPPAGSLETVRRG